MKDPRTQGPKDHGTKGPTQLMHDCCMVAFRRVLPVSLAILCLSALTATQGSRGAPTESISLGGLERRLRFIASDALEGRDPLSPGFRAAAEYLVAELARLGATPRGDDGTFLQRVTMRRSAIQPATTAVEVDGEVYTYGKDLLAEGAGTARGPVVYVGHGWRMPARGIDPYHGLDVRGSILLALSGLPPGVTEGELKALTQLKDYWKPIEAARDLGAAGLILVPAPDELSGWTRVVERQGQGTLVVDRLAEPADLPVVTASPRLLAAVLRGERETAERLQARAGARDPGSPYALDPSRRVRMVVDVEVTREDTFNVVASIEGSDPVKAPEYVALGAHLDHIGRLPSSGTPASQGLHASGDPAPVGDEPDVINNGADDDGSGVVALVEIAGAVARGPRPGRSLLFVWHTGEEAGGWGARYFTAFPPVPLDRIVAQLNLDMIGRSRRHGDGRNPRLTGSDEVYLVGAHRLSRELGETIARVNRDYLNLTLNPAHDDPGDPERIYERSDHYEYAKHGIPVAFFFSGLHEDYHRPSDEVEHIDFVKLQKIARTVLASAWALADAPDRPRRAPSAPATRE
jgi:hypothetical protein